MKRSFFLFVCAALCVATEARAQLALTHDAQAWGLVTAEGRFYREAPALYFLEAQPRFSLNAGGMTQALLRSAVGFAFTPWLSVWGGSAWVPAADWANGTVLSAGEGRAFQQVLASGKPFGGAFGGALSGVTITSRSRFEQRAIAGLDGVSLRGRTLLRAVVPVALDGALSVVAFDEVFGVFNDVAGGPTRGFDQNRAFLGARYALHKQAALEAGYLNRVFRDQRMEHALVTWLAFRFE